MDITRNLGYNNIMGSLSQLQISFFRSNMCACTMHAKAKINHIERFNLTLRNVTSFLDNVYIEVVRDF